MINPDSTSYPTLVVIQHYGLSEDVARLLWRSSDEIAAAVWARDGLLVNSLAEGLNWMLAFSGVDQHGAVTGHLVRNVERAVRWCRENAHG